MFNVFESQNDTTFTLTEDDQDLLLPIFDEEPTTEELTHLMGVDPVKLTLVQFR